MKITWEYRFPLPYPVIRFPLPIPDISPPVMSSSASAVLCQGNDDCLGVAIWPSGSPKGSGHAGLVSFFEIHLDAKRVSHTSETIAPKFLSDVDIVYDRQHAYWVCATKHYGETGDEYGFYQVAPTSTPQWLKVTQIKGDEEIGTGYKPMIAFRSGDRTGTCVVVVPDIGETDDAQLYWMTWSEISEGKNLMERRSIGHCDQGEARMTEQGCLMVVVERVLDTYLSPQRDRTGPGIWQVSCKTYTLDGDELHQQVLPEFTSPIRHPHLPPKDFWKAFDLYFLIEPGPPSGKEQQATWMVAIAFREPKQSSSQSQPAEQAEAMPRKLGRLLWLDQQGYLLRSEEGIVAEEMTLCCCGKEVVGTALRDGVWQLWHWGPEEAIPMRLGAVLPEGIERATVLAEQGQADDASAFFWCIEEYATGVRVTQRTCLDDEEKSVLWLEGFTMCHDGSGAYRYMKCAGIALNQGRLILLGVGQHETFELLCIQR